MKNNALIAVFIFSVSSFAIIYIHKDDVPPPPTESWNISGFKEISAKWAQIDQEYDEKRNQKDREEKRRRKEIATNAIKLGAGIYAEKNKEKGESDD